MPKPRRASVVAAAALVSAAGLPALAQEDRQVKESISAHIVRPRQVEATDERVQQIQLPEGFRIRKFAEGLENPRMLAVGPDGSLYATRRKQGDVIRLRDTNGDGRADEVDRVVTDLADVHGIAFHDGMCYLATIHEVYVCRVQPDGSLETPRMIIGDIPDGGQHPNRTIAIGPDGMLYISVGSTCNACEEPNPEHATMLRAAPDGSRRTIFARGLRNTVGFAWHPGTRELWGMDHGTDWLGDDVNREELNRIVEGADYGWPYVFEDGKPNPIREPDNLSYEEYAARSEPSVLTYTAHAAPMQMVFYTGRGFPREYRGDAFVAMRGSWNRNPPSGYEVVRIRFEDGQPETIEPFATGWLIEEGSAHFGRLAGIAAGMDGELFVSDDTNGVIYRITYEGPRGQQEASR